MSGAQRASSRREGSEAALAERWAAGYGGRLRCEDGRILQVVFPGVPGGGAGPDFTGAVIDLAGDLLHGDVEIHLAASGWRSHGHAHDPAFANVVLHVVAVNDAAAVATVHASGRSIPLVVLPRDGETAYPPPFTPPCNLAAAQGEDVAAALARMGERRLRSKIARAHPAVAAIGPGPALYALLLETLGGGANRTAFASLARSLPLPALLERVDGSDAPRALALAAELRGLAASLVLRRAGLRPLASPGARLTSAGALFARLWPAGSGAHWPAALSPGSGPASLRVPGVGAGTAIELMVNAVLPVAGTGPWNEGEVLDTFARLRSPGTYGRLRRLERWLSPAGTPFPSARALQGGLALHGDYCTKGACGRCPLSR